VLWPAGGGQPRELPLPAGYQGAAVGIADDGSVLAQASQQLSNTTSFRWTAQGVRQELPTTKPGNKALVTAVQGHWAAGFESDPATGRSTTVRWNLRTGAVQVLPSMDVNAVNGRGDVAGQAGAHAALVRGTTLVTLPGLAAKASGAEALSDTGAVAGFARDATNAVHAVTWHCGR
jgi:hypothetical protein